MLRLKKFIVTHKSGSLVLLLFVISLLIMVASTDDKNLINVKKISSGTLSTIQLGISNITGFIIDSITSIGKLRRLQNDYFELQKMLTNYQSIERDLIELKNENNRLRELLQLSQAINYDHIVAKIIARDPSNIFSTIIINKGEAHGVSTNSAVVANQKGFQGLVGKIIEVDSYTSKILPIIDPNSYVAVRTQQTRYEGLANGMGTHISIQYIEKSADKEIQYGDLVVTSGLQSIYPAGIYVGRIRSILAPEWLPSLEIKLEPIIDFSRIEYVFIIDGEKY